MVNRRRSTEKLSKRPWKRSPSLVLGPGAIGGWTKVKWEKHLAVAFQGCHFFAAKYVQPLLSKHHPRDIGISAFNHDAWNTTCYCWWGPRRFQLKGWPFDFPCTAVCSHHLAIYGLSHWWTRMCATIDYVHCRDNRGCCHRKLREYHSHTCWAIYAPTCWHWLPNLGQLCGKTSPRSSINGWAVSSREHLKLPMQRLVKNWAFRRMRTAGRLREPVQPFTQTKAAACQARSLNRRRSPLNVSKHGET